MKNKKNENLTEINSAKVFDKIAGLIEQARGKVAMQSTRRWFYFTGILGKQLKKR